MVHLVPKTGISFAEMADYAAGVGWEIDKTSLRRAQNTDLPSYLWRINRGESVALCKAADIKTDYFVVQSENVECICSVVRNRFPCYEESELHSMVVRAKSSLEKVESLQLISALAPARYDKKISEALNAHASDPDRSVRWQLSLLASTCRGGSCGPSLSR